MVMPMKFENAHFGSKKVLTAPPFSESYPLFDASV
jgi:hypothetical protein